MSMTEWSNPVPLYFSIFLVAFFRGEPNFLLRSFVASLGIQEAISGGNLKSWLSMKGFEGFRDPATSPSTKLKRFGMIKSFCITEVRSFRGDVVLNRDLGNVIGPCAAKAIQLQTPRTFPIFEDVHIINLHPR